MDDEPTDILWRSVRRQKWAPSCWVFVDFEELSGSLQRSGEVTLSFFSLQGLAGVEAAQAQMAQMRAELEMLKQAPKDGAPVQLHVADFCRGAFFSGNHQTPRRNGRFLKRTMVEKNGESTPGTLVRLSRMKLNPLWRTRIDPLRGAVVEQLV